MVSNLPSSFSKGSSSYSSFEKSAQQSTSQETSQQRQDGQSNLAITVAFIALLVSIASFYFAFFAERPLSAHQKEQLLGIANDLRSLQNRDIKMTAPMYATVRINKTYPIRDMFPASFDVPLEFSIPINTQLVAVSTTGQPVIFRVDENVPIKAKIQINSQKAFGDHNITINKEMPIEATWSSDIKVRAAYGQDLNDIIDRLEKLAGEGS
ncbi:MAG: hypothetical protein N3G80_02285 [Candidatus Micrarchaeota archaeon]|nr:hypothetical protein [Candidatus Micrarchaeota archaeon]